MFFPVTSPAYLPTLPMLSFHSLYMYLTFHCPWLLAQASVPAVYNMAFPPLPTPHAHHFPG